MSQRSRSRKLTAEQLETRENPVSFSIIQGYWSGSDVDSIAVGDVNSDGYADIIAGTFGSGIQLFINDGTGQFTQTGSVSMGPPIATKLADLNGDGNLDILVADGDAAIGGEHFVFALGNGDGTFQTPVFQNIGRSAQDVVATDVNGDGKLDAVVATGIGAAVFVNDGSADVFGTPTYYDTLSTQDGSAVAAGDFNGDGKSDFAIDMAYANRTDIYLNNGDGTFGTPTSIANPVSNQMGNVVVGDFNNDGNLDLVVGYVYSTSVGLLLGNGDGTFQNPVIFNTSDPNSGIATIATTDFDNDGNRDLVVMTWGLGSEVVLRGDGAGGFGPSEFVISVDPGSVAVGDVNGDGLADIVNGQGLSPGTVNVSINTTEVHVLSSFTVTAPEYVTIGEPFTITVTANDELGNILTGYTGTVHFTSTDELAGLPADYKFSPSDNGTATFTATLNSVGNWTITATDIDTDIAGTSDSIAALPEAPGSLIDRGQRGLWLSAGGEQVKISNLNAQSAVMAADGETVVADFGRRGLWCWSADGWDQLARANVEKVKLSADGESVVADFGAGGLRRWSDTDGWDKLTWANAQSYSISADGTTVVADFGYLGLWRWTESANWWTRITRANVERVALAPDGSAVVADFGGGVVRKWSAATKEWVPQALPQARYGAPAAAKNGSLLKWLDNDGIWVG